MLSDKIERANVLSGGINNPIMETDMNKKILTVVLLIALFIPSFVAVGYYSSTKEEPGDVKSVSELKIEDLSGMKWEFETGDGNPDSEKMINLFVNLKKNASEVTALPDAMKNEDFFLITLTSYEVESEYKYYFTTSTADAYLVDSSSKVYKLGQTEVAEFLSTKYSASLYKATATPTLNIAGLEIMPAALAWNYASYNGEFIGVDVTDMITSEIKTCTLDGGLELSFSEKPDYVKITVKNGEEVIFSDSIEKLSELSLAGGDNFKIDVAAEWYQSTEKDFYGSASYSFIGDIIDPAVFYIGQTEIRNGEFVVVGGKNVDDPSKVTFASEPAIDYVPTFYKEGDYVYALVPIAMEYENGSDQVYTFTLTYGATTQTMSLNVKSYSYGRSNSSVSAQIENATYSEAARKEAEDALLPIAQSQGLSTHKFEGKFLDKPFSKDATISPGFGRTITVTATGTQYRHTGCDYKVAEGADTYAINAGEVVYSGYLTTTGYIVVIDHGWGLRTWYCHLSECTAKVGDIVAKGDVIGKAGDTGFAAKGRTHIGLTVGDVPVRVYYYEENEISIPDFASSLVTE